MSSFNTSPQPIQFDSAPLEAIPDNLYQAHAIVTQGVKSLSDFNAAHIEQFRQDGFLVLEDAFTPVEVSGALHGLLDLINGKNPDFTGISYEARARDMLDQLTGEQRQDAVRKFMWFVDYEPRLKALSEKPGLLAVLEQLIGEPVTMFQDMALVKPPRIGREKPWHQDFAYFNLPLGTQVVGVWIALDEALIENGCMHVIPGSHREGPVVHFQRRDWQICDTDVQIQRTVAVPLRPGSCLLFDGLLHHGTPPSQSDRRRRALQFHYRPASVQPFADSTQRLAVFGDEGKDVTC